MKKEDISKELSELPVPRQETAKHAIDMSNKAARIASKLELIGDKFISGEITKSQATVAYRAYSAAGKNVRTAHFARNQITILPNEE